MTVTASERQRIQRRLLGWFRRHQRALPWRRTRDPYRIWVSEIMLQQTQVKTVVPYYRRWMRRFPTIKSLAAAPFDRVLKSWEGLGYYRRARFLHQAAGIIVSRHGGVFPRAFASVLALPGVGRYTAGAVCSIAFGLRVPALDGNVTRVLCRYFNLRGDTANVRAQERLWSVAEALLPRRQPGAFNEAMMELGATVCLPRTPACGRCPLRGGCRAFRRGTWKHLPNSKKRIVIEKSNRVAAVVNHPCRTGAMLMCRQNGTGLLGALWRLPTIDAVTARDEAESAQIRELERRFETEFGLRLRLTRRRTTIRHTVTRYRVTLAVWDARPLGPGFEGAGPNGRQWRWIDRRGLRDTALDAASRRALEAVW